MIKGLLIKCAMVLLFVQDMTYAEGVLQEKLYYENPIIEIEKIDLKQEFYPYDKDKNVVDKNIQVINGSKMPDVVNSNLILASHSGNSSIAYFKNLDKLNVSDTVYIYYKDRKYKYVIADIYEVEKTGYVEIKRRHDKNTLTLITCKRGTNKQFVFIGYLVLAGTP